MKTLDPYKKYTLPEPQSETEKLIDQIYSASANWYKTHDMKYVDLYHEIYRKLRLLGWNGGIDVEAELPNELMPPEYIRQIDAQEEFDFQAVNLPELFRHIISSSQDLVKSKPIKIELEELSPVPMGYTDPVRLNQVMLNLVGNAIKFTPKGNIKVRYGLVKNTIRIEVEDSGPPIESEQLSSIFERFSRVDITSVRRETGRGFVLLKRLLGSDDGSIGVELHEVGSTLFFTVPIAEGEIVRKTP